MFRSLMIAARSSMAANSASNSTAELRCRSCKVTQTVRREDKGAHRECPYCGAFYDAELENALGVTTAFRSASARSLRSSYSHRRTASPRLPSVKNNRRGSKAVEDTAVGNLLASSLTSLTLGSLGLGGDGDGDQDKLPKLPNDAKNRLVQIGSGNNNNNNYMNNAVVKAEDDDVPGSNYDPVDIDRERFVEMLDRAKSTKDFDEITKLYTDMFKSPVGVCSTFKEKPLQDGAKSESPELKMELLYLILDSVKALNVTAQKAVIRSVVNCLLDDGSTLLAKDKTRCLFVLLQNPLFVSQSTYTILAHLLQQITRLPNADHQLLVHWFRSVPEERLRHIIQVVLQFVTVRQFPPADKSLPPLSKSRWWIPTATKVLALINAANNIAPATLDYTEFYNISLDHMDLMQEYYTWQNPERANQFSYCQYPFILSIVAKQHILTKDSEQQMILTARRSLVQKMARHQQPQIEIFFLNITVRRSNLVEDSLKEISEKQKDLKKKLKISFVGEPGLDMGGLTKEWFQLLIRKIFDPDYGMFVYFPHSRCYWFSVSKQGNLREYNLIGVLMGLAVYNSIILDLHFPSVCYKKLLTPPVVPAGEASSVGVVTDPTVDDLAEIMPDVAQSLKGVLDYDGNVADDLIMPFQASIEEYGKVITHDLKPNGKSEIVSNANRHEFVKLYLEWILNTTINERFRAFYLGFHSVCASNALIMLRPEEVEQMVCGSQTFDLAELKKVTFYDGYKKDDITVQHFWEVLEAYSEELQKKFLLFTTGSDRVPVGGTSDMTIKITRMHRDKTDRLPVAHTCFNQIVLPDYKEKDKLKRKLTIAISNAEGFGLE